MSRLRTTVSRIAARGAAEPASENASALDNLRPETPEPEETEATEDSAQGELLPRGGVEEPAARRVVTREVPVTAGHAHLELPVKKARKAHAPKETPQKTTDALSGPALRSELKDLEAKIKDTRLRHNTELDALRRRHSELTNRLFDLIR